MPPIEVLIRLVHYGVTSRLRHRALLDVLKDGAFDYQKYLQVFENIVERDRDALFAKLMLSKDDFRSLFKEWESEDQKRYGITKTPKKRLRRTADSVEI